MGLISVVIPLYNKGNHIKATLESVLNQTFQDFEIIVVNDGSTDKSESEVLKLDSPKIKYFKTENQGVSQARNFGIEKARGTLLAFLDADDYWYPHHLEDLYFLYQQYPGAGFFATNYEFYYSENRIEYPKFLDISSEFKHGIVKDFFKSSYLYRLTWTSAVAIPKTVIQEIGGFDPNITLGAGEDIDYWIRVALKHKVAFHNRISARYRMDGENRISHSNTLRRKFAKLDQFQQEEQTNYWLKKYLDLYRAEFALKFKLAGDKEQFLFYKKALTPSNISLKTRLLLSLPTPLLRGLYRLKKVLENKGIFVSAYH